MKTKNIFSLLAMAMMMPAMMLTTACSSEDDAIINDEPTVEKGFELPVTINVTRQGDDATRAEYDTSTKKLSFSEGDKLYVGGVDSSTDGAGEFAGTLDWVSEGTFSGTITTRHAYTGTAEQLFMAAQSSVYVSAFLLPNGYGSHGYFYYNKRNVYDGTFTLTANNAFALTKAEAVEQFSLEMTDSYSSGTGFTLSPQNAILNFTITGLTDNSDVSVALSGTIAALIGTTPLSINKTVTTDASGNAHFSIGVLAGTNLSNLSLTVDGKAITLTTSSKQLAAGHVYNITRSALIYPVALSAVTRAYVGSVVTTDGNVYATAAAATAANETAVAIIAYVGSAGSVEDSNASYKGLAIAMDDANDGEKCQWYTENSGTCVNETAYSLTADTYKNGIECTNTLVNSNGSVTTECNGHTHAAAIAARNNNNTAAPSGASNWFLPSMGQWNLIVQGLATKKNGSAVTTDINNNTNNNYKDSNLNSVITDAGGTGFQSDGLYWSSTGFWTTYVWIYCAKQGYTLGYPKKDNYYVRSVVAF